MKQVLNVRRMLVTLVLVLLVSITGLGCSSPTNTDSATSPPQSETSSAPQSSSGTVTSSNEATNVGGRKESVSVRLGLSPFQDTLLPYVGVEKGWYEEVGLDVDVRFLGWTEVMEALSAGEVDVAVNNISSVIATHQRNHDLVYFYGMNPFDNGFALIIRPESDLKQLQYFLDQGLEREDAIRATAAQLKGKTVITTGNTDMEQGVFAAARRGGLDFSSDINIIDMNPDEGLASFLTGEGDAYIGGVPQRTRAVKEGFVEMLTGASLGPPPINGFVTTSQYFSANEPVILKLLHVWFRTVQTMNRDISDGGDVIVETLNRQSGAQFTLDDLRSIWNKVETFVDSPDMAQELILNSNGRNYWKARWDDCNQYFMYKGTISSPVNPADAFLMREAQESYLKAYGSEGN